MSSTISKHVNIPIYGGSLNIHVTPDAEFDKLLAEVNYEGELECDACCIYNVDGGRCYDLIFKEGRIQHGLIAHECFHLTMRIMKEVNKAYDVSNDEPEAYLIQFLVSTVYEFLKENKKRVK